MCTPEPHTMARETVPAGWFSSGHELHRWGQGWSLIPENYAHPQMDNQGMEAGKTTSPPACFPMQVKAPARFVHSFRRCTYVPGPRMGVGHVKEEEREQEEEVLPLSERTVGTKC